jgi:uncharacterized protein (TIGR00730 family)
VTRICVFCGSAGGDNPDIRVAAEQLAIQMSKCGTELVYGGGHVGLMGTLADALLSAGGTVTGVIPKDLVTNELAHPGVTRLHVVQSMHERKALMNQLSDGFIVLPGGFGTLDELCEVLTWRQLGIHDKKIVLLNVNGYFDALLNFFYHACATGFVTEKNMNFLSVVDTPKQALDNLANNKN